jgi:hypothetical protein
MNVVDLIDLTEEDDDDIEFTGEAMGSNARRAGGRRGSPNSGPLWQDLRSECLGLPLHIHVLS